jgi:hypothetical protein
MMKLIKKSEKLLLDKIKIMEEEEELNLKPEVMDEAISWNEEKAIANVENLEPNYIPVRDNPVVQSVGNTGWQISEIWKEIRLDSF